MKLYDAKGRLVEEGNRIRIAATRYEPYVAFRERPDDDPDLDPTSPLAVEFGAPETAA